MTARTLTQKALGALSGIGMGVLFAALPASVFAQSSPSHTQDEHVFNAGGRPAEAVISSSSSFRISLDSIGEAVLSRSMTSASFRVGGGLGTAYPPPGEVNDLQILLDRQTLSWSPEPSSTAYNVYSGLLSSLPGGFGTCAVAHVEGTSAVDAALPNPGAGFFYLVTGVSRLREEGTKGRTSAGAVRPNPLPCP